MSLVQHFFSINSSVACLPFVVFHSIHLCLRKKISIYFLIFISIFAILDTACLVSYSLVAESHSFSSVPPQVAGLLSALSNRSPTISSWL